MPVYIIIQLIETAVFGLHGQNALIYSYALGSYSVVQNRIATPAIGSALQTMNSEEQ